jgi:phosphoglycerol transferase MdoB-like AlkP superfamily enzyme
MDTYEKNSYTLRYLKVLFNYSLFYFFLMFLTRVAFWVLYGTANDIRENLRDTAHALFLGWRYDVSVLSYVLVLPLLVLFLSFFVKNQIFHRSIRHFLRFHLYLFTLAILVVNLLDFCFYEFFQEHINIIFFGLMEDDTSAVLKSIMKEYNVFAWFLLVAAIFYLIWKVIRWLTRKIYIRPMYSSSAFVLLILIALLGLWRPVSRASFTRLAVSIIDAEISNNRFVNHVSVSGVIALNDALRMRMQFKNDGRNLLQQNGFGSLKSALKAYWGSESFLYDPDRPFLSFQRKTPVNPKLEAKPPHVLMFLMESLGSGWFDYNAENFPITTPLEKHFKEDYFFKNFLPSDNGTTGSLISLLTATDLRAGAMFLSQSKYKSTPLDTSIQLPYDRAGYETVFIYAGKLGWRNCGSYVKALGFQKVYGAQEILKKLGKDPDENMNEWGTTDEIMYQFIQKLLTEATKPLFIFSLSISNHPPFDVPKTFTQAPLEIPSMLKGALNRNLDHANQRFRSYQYANYALAHFLDWIKETHKDNTVVGVTGDHSFWLTDEEEDGEKFFSRYAVPFYLYLPEYLRDPAINPNNYGSHKDIAPTLYELTLSNATYVSFGHSFAKQSQIAVNSKGIFAKDGVLLKNYGAKDLTHPFTQNYKASIAIQDNFLEWCYQKDRNEKNASK